MNASTAKTANIDTHSTPYRWTDRDIPDQTHRTVVVTGANSGLGFLTSLKLAQHGARVIMTARDLRKGRDARARIEADHTKGSVELRQLDLADLTQVKAFAKQLLADGTRIDVLINNAGIMMPPRALTAQGYELQFGVNHLAHFALTSMLLPRIRASAEGRVVTISSDLHKRGRIHFDDLTGERKYGRIEFYAQSKFANVLFALELDRRLRATGTPIKSVLAHPGYAATNLQLNGPSGILKLFLRFGNRFLAQSAEMGVLPQLFAATAPEVDGGDFIGPDGRNEKKGYPTRVQPVAEACDLNLAERLWQRSVELTGMSPDFSMREGRPHATTCRGD
jgi:NAD(P)-dependent dehydrogenase (short-subunit alcohol dehydrogenase family)